MTQILPNQTKSVIITWIIEIFKNDCVPVFLMYWPFRNFYWLVIFLEDASYHFLAKWGLPGRNKACWRNVFRKHEKIFVILCAVVLAVPGKRICDLSTYFVWNSKPKPLLSYCLVKRKSNYSFNWRLSCYKLVKLDCLRSL